MKTSIMIRFTLAVILVTAGCVAMLAQANFSNFVSRGCFAVAGILLIRPSEFTRPIVGTERRKVLIFVTVFLVVMLSLPFLYLHSNHEKDWHVLGSPEVVVPLWFAWLWAIYLRWKREIRGADAQDGTSTKTV